MSNYQDLPKSLRSRGEKISDLLAGHSPHFCKKSKWCVIFDDAIRTSNLIEAISIAKAHTLFENGGRLKIFINHK